MSEVELKIKSDENRNEERVCDDKGCPDCGGKDGKRSDSSKNEVPACSGGRCRPRRFIFPYRRKNTKADRPRNTRKD